MRISSYAAGEERGINIALHNTRSISQFIQHFRRGNPWLEPWGGSAALLLVDFDFEQAALIVEVIPRAALFLAGKAFLQYRRQKRTKSGVLPDFFIGAYATVLGVPLLTRDRGRYGYYFPTLTLIAPD
ncbi:hypothetical protein CCP3SC5AM1_1150010 [Gammaproteobacteria bacterium]